MNESNGRNSSTASHIIFVIGISLWITSVLTIKLNLSAPTHAMKRFFNYIFSSIATGILIVAPVYLSVLVLLKATVSLGHILHPFVELLPAWMQSKTFISAVSLLFLTFLIGSVLRTSIGRRARSQLERNLFKRIPGYDMFRGFTQRLAGNNETQSWRPAMVETDDNALMPAFIIEELADGRYTVFVPSVPTPFAGAVFVYHRDRVHEVDVPFTHAVSVISRWGEGAKEMVAAIKPTTG